MFYLITHTDEKQFKPGDVVMVLADFSGIEAGTRGVITEIYDGGVMVTWASLSTSYMNKLNTVDKIQERLREGEIFSAGHGWINDGFGRDELEYLAVRTDVHPGKISPTV